MTILTEEYTAAQAAYNRAFDRVQELVPPDVWRELDDARADLLAAHEAEVLSHLVIAVDHDGTFPRLSTAISTAGCEPVHVDECEHRAIAASARAFDELGGTGDVPDRMRNAARALLERDLGNEAEEERLSARVWAGVAS